MPASAIRQAAGVVHPCLESLPRAVPLGEARLTDRRKVGVLLQAAGLLSLLDRAGWRLASGWQPAHIAADGRLAIGEDGAAPGRSTEPARDLLLDLVARLFGEGAVPGRGEGRRAVRALLDSWRQSLVPLSPDEAVVRILDVAAFLWEPEHAAARRALAGGVERGAGGVRPWMAGPRPLRARVLLRCRSAAELQDLLAGPEARALWNEEEEGTPAELAAAGRWRAAAAAWERRPPVTADEHLGLAAALASLGRFEASLASLSGLRSPAARALAVRCQLDLGQLGAAQATLRELEKAPLPPRQIAELAEIASRVCANHGKPGRAGFWLRRALAETTGDPGSAVLARLAAAGAAWDRGDAAAMDRYLEAARPALDEPDLAWRWHHVRALRAMMEEDGGREAVAAIARALQAGRRRLTRRQAAGLWNDLGLGRARAGDLSGAERAFLHVARLEAGCDGPRRTTLAFCNLAEIRLRRGRLAGVREILVRSEEENRRSGNLRGIVQDLGLWARFELALGRPAAALALCREALAELDRQRADWHRDVLHLLAARALGWLGRPAEAAAELEPVPAETLSELEPEERPALMAHAGDRAEARRQAAGAPLAPLWERLLAGEPAPTRDWEALGALEPYRAARLVYDLDLLAPGSAPVPWRRAAIATFRKLGAASPAERLEARDGGPWAVLEGYLARDREDPRAWEVLLAGAGHPEAEISWTGNGAGPPAADGDGAVELSADLDDGRLVLRAARDDDALRAAFALLVRDASRHPSGNGRRPEEKDAAAPERPAGGLIGESAVLRAALERIARLAPGDLPVLILGESGTGKELAARQLHRASPRSGGSFVPVNCAALSETLLLSDLFGHARGAFTGADRDRKGVFETAHGGTVFLDEIGDLPLSAQGLLLRVLQEGEIRRLGESEARRVSVRVLAATHRDLVHMVEEGTFRRDLYYRLRVGCIELPPLRDRGEDVLRIADHILARLRRHPPARISREARALLLVHRWPGNVRELENVLAVAAALAGDEAIRPEHLELSAGASAPEAPYHQQVDSLRRRLVTGALEECGNRAEAARRLGISRQALSYLVRQLGLEGRAARRS
ncbi:MAG TPA: sigma 54-interacting transcriptional regulator [Thermoanaerobaculia bacterium]|jgi:DNA-binding NtrC family response regulator|nr:sigma 54-interacting transcriptional regulator [Thermoanaerobaculia bacterium]